MVRLSWVLRSLQVGESLDLENSHLDWNPVDPLNWAICFHTFPYILSLWYQLSRPRKYLVYLRMSARTIFSSFSMYHRIVSCRGPTAGWHVLSGTVGSAPCSRVFSSDTGRVIDPEIQKDIDRILELADKSLDTWQVQMTQFYSPAVVYDAVEVLSAMSDIRVIPEGGYTQAERQRIVMGREETMYGYSSRDSIALVQVRGNFMFDRATHPDFLGACLGTGIERHVIGDIIVQGDEGAQIICLPSIVEHLESTLVQVRSVPVKTQLIDISELHTPEPRIKQVQSIEASLRVDAIASAGFRMSRAKMTEMIASGDVRLNWKGVKKPSSIVKKNDMLSARGKGRLEIVDVEETRKGKYIVSMRRFY